MVIIALGTSVCNRVAMVVVKRNANLAVKSLSLAIGESDFSQVSATSGPVGRSSVLSAIGVGQIVGLQVSIQSAAVSLVSGDLAVVQSRSEHRDSDGDQHQDDGDDDQQLGESKTTV